MQVENESGAVGRERNASVRGADDNPCDDRQHSHATDQRSERLHQRDDISTTFLLLACKFIGSDLLSHQSRTAPFGRILTCEPKKNGELGLSELPSCKERREGNQKFSLNAN